MISYSVCILNEFISILILMLKDYKSFQYTQVPQVNFLWNKVFIFKL